MENKKRKVVFSLRIKEETYQAVRETAQKEHRSVNAQIEVFIENSIREYKEGIAENKEVGTIDQDYPYRYISRKLRNFIKQRDNYTCQYCGSTENITIDHIIPNKSGGTNTAKNLVACCWKCNFKKGSKSLEQAGMKLLREAI